MDIKKAITKSFTKAQLEKRGWVFIKSWGGTIYATCGDKEFSAKSIETLKKRIAETI